jgi:hypothetical protein
MAENEKTSADIASLAAAILGGARYNEADILRLAGSVLTQAADHTVLVEGEPAPLARPRLGAEALFAKPADG